MSSLRWLWNTLLWRPSCDRCSRRVHPDQQLCDRCRAAGGWRLAAKRRP